MSAEKKDPKPGTGEWEDLCRRCARCCYEKLDYRGRIYYTNKACPHLDTVTNNCRVYVERAERHPECARLTPELVAAGFLPADCPYVAGLENYSAPEIDEP